jgi:hypothetical protein
MWKETFYKDKILNLPEKAFSFIIGMEKKLNWKPIIISYEKIDNGK